MKTKLFALIALVASACASTAALAGPTYTARIPLRALVVTAGSTSTDGAVTPSSTSGTGGTSTSGGTASSGSSSGTVSPSGTGETATPVAPVYTPQQYTFNPGMNETFYIPADATNQSYYYYVKPDYQGHAMFYVYQDEVRVWYNGGTAGGWSDTVTETTRGSFKIFPGHAYRFYVTIGSLYASKLTYTK